MVPPNKPPHGVCYLARVGDEDGRCTATLRAPNCVVQQSNGKGEGSLGEWRAKEQGVGFEVD
eukprot:scaffold2291_cov363-Pavlova_lutheri.AAC.2